MTAEPWVELEQINCADPECPGKAEAEQDGDHRYWACLKCGYTFGFEKVPQTEEVCSLGIPEETRRLHPGPAPDPQPVFMTLGRRP